MKQCKSKLYLLLNKIGSQKISHLKTEKPTSLKAGLIHYVSEPNNSRKWFLKYSDRLP